MDVADSRALLFLSVCEVVDELQMMMAKSMVGSTSGLSPWFTRSRSPENSSENFPADMLTDEDGAVAVVHQKLRNKS